MHPNVARVAAAAERLGVPVEPSEFPAGTRTAADAAAALGCDVAQIVKSLVFVLDGAPVMALVSGANRLDEARLAVALGGTQVACADADAVRDATGFAIGGVAPFGHPSSLPTAIDEDLLDHVVVWAAAGTPNHVFPLSPGDLVQLTDGVVHPLRTVSADGG
ncbi:MAG: YbaK/EbsC family protein [Acidimicrobiales bacterium]|nr:YbaK/EbsC family protein [Acidimicrobiales bacterium]